MILKNRICRIGPSINTRTEMNGDEGVAAIDVPIRDFALTEAELNFVLGDEHAHRALFDTGKNPAEPIFRQLQPLALKDKFEDCEATLRLGLSNDEIRLSGAKLAKIRLEPATGGLTAMSCTVQVAPNLDHMPLLMRFMDHEIECAISVGQRAVKSKDTQGNLPLDDEGETEDEAEEELA